VKAANAHVKARTEVDRVRGRAIVKQMANAPNARTIETDRHPRIGVLGVDLLQMIDVDRVGLRLSACTQRRPIAGRCSNRYCPSIVRSARLS
jgi:hypothetical protein